jgi:hypothetical protein
MGRAVSASATARQADWFIARRAERERPRGCERRQIALRRTEEERAEAFFLCERRRRRQPSEHRRERSEQSDRARLREQQAQTTGREQPPKETSVGPSKYELQGPTV